MRTHQSKTVVFILDFSKLDDPVKLGPPLRHTSPSFLLGEDRLHSIQISFSVNVQISVHLVQLLVDLLNISLFSGVLNDTVSQSLTCNSETPKAIKQKVYWAAQCKRPWIYLLAKTRPQLMWEYLSVLFSSLRVTMFAFCYRNIIYVFYYGHCPGSCWDLHVMCIICKLPS